MNMNAVLPVAIGLVVLLVSPARAQDFRNLDFENAAVVGEGGFDGFELPFWNTSGFRLFNLVCLGSVCTSIHDEESMFFSPLEGENSIHIDPGTAQGAVNQLWQVGVVPANATIVSVLVETEDLEGFEVSFNNMPLTLLSQNPNLLLVFDVSPFAGSTGELRISQLAPPVTSKIDTGALLDDIRFRSLGDVNLDGLVNLLDVQPFVDRLSTGTFQVEADINHDGTVDLFDVEPFIGVLTN